MSKFTGPLPLQAAHDTTKFDCGNEALNRFLTRRALANQANRSARTFVGLDGDRVIGYYSLAVGAVLFDEAPERMATGLAKHPIPILLMARFGVDREYQGQGVGRGLFRDALKRCLSVANEAGVRALMTHAKDEAAQSVYMRFGMEPCPSNPLHLYLLLKDVERILRGTTHP